MDLDESQKKQVTAWITEGLKLSEIQNRLASAFGIRLTYMEVRMLVDDLKLVPKDPEPPKSASPLAKPPEKPAAPARADAAAAPAEPAPPTGKVTLTVDELTRPGAMVSGRVTFSDGNTAEWYLDESGRLGLMPKKSGYRPSAADVQQFQLALETQLGQMGL
jgi:hypothetical protein